MQVIGKATTLFDRVEFQSINETDNQSDAAGDIMCYKDDTAVLVVEVKDKAVTLTDCSDTVTKARGSCIADVLFAAPDIQNEHETAIGAFKNKMRREGCNVCHADIVSIMRHMFILDEK